MITLSLKCPNCGGNLEISPEMSSFACGYCGVSQVVERQGGTVSLSLVTDAVAKVQIGTDKTAAELAIQRLKGEMNECSLKFSSVEIQKNQAISKNSSTYFTAFFIVLILSLCRLSQYPDVIYISASIIFVVESFIVYFWSKGKKEIINKYQPELTLIASEYQTLEKKVGEQKIIIET